MDLLKDKFDYYPNRDCKHLVRLLTVIILIPLCVLAMMFLYFKEMTGFKYMMILLIISLLMIEILVYLSKLKVFFSNTALYIQYGVKTRIAEYKYEKYLFAYYCKDYKGNEFLILSECELDKKRVKRIANIGGGIGVTLYDSCVVILIDESNKQIDDIKKHISEKIKNVYEFL